MGYPSNKCKESHPILCYSARPFEHLTSILDIASSVHPAPHPRTNLHARLAYCAHRGRNPLRYLVLTYPQ